MVSNQAAIVLHSSSNQRGKHPCAAISVHYMYVRLFVNVAKTNHANEHSLQPQKTCADTVDAIKMLGLNQRVEKFECQQSFAVKNKKMNFSLVLTNWLVLLLLCNVDYSTALTSKEWIERPESELRSAYGETGYPCVVLGPKHCYEYRAQCSDGICTVSGYQEGTPAERARLQQMLSAAQSSGCPYANMMANMDIEDVSLHLFNLIPISSTI